MNTTVLQENLLPKLQDAAHFISSKSSLPILSGVLIRAKDSQLLIRTTDLKVGFETYLGGKVEAEGECVLSAKLFVELLSTLRPGPIKIIVDDKTAHITQEKVTAQLATFPVEDFPPFPQIGEESIEVEMRALLSAIDMVSFAASLDDTRPILASLLFQFYESSVVLVATDGYRLATVERTLTGKEIQEQRFLLPAKTTIEVARILDKEKARKSRIYRSEKLAQVSIVCGETTIIIHETEGDYPKYETIIPPSFAHTLTLSRESLLSGLKTAMVFARESSSIVTLHCSADEVRLIGAGATAGKNETILDGRAEIAKELTISLNAKFLLDLLTRVGGTTVTMSVNEELKPILLRPSEDEQFTYIVMPFKK